MRYFIVHLHRLLDPGQTQGVSQATKPAKDTKPAN
jgi:hypothetical protein